MAASTPEVTGEIHAFAMRRAQRPPSNPDARIRQDIYDQFDSKERLMWRDIPTSMRMKINQGYSKPPPTDSRQALQHVASVKDQPSIIDISDHQTAQSGVTKSADLTVKSSAQSKSSAPSKPLRSELGPAHPSRLLSDSPNCVYNGNGKPLGFLTAKFHAWLSPSDNDDNTAIPPPSYTVSKRDVRRSNDALVDRGANGFVGGSDCVLIGKPADG